jgi:hypothetical protein
MPETPPAEIVAALLEDFHSLAAQLTPEDEPALDFAA